MKNRYIILIFAALLALFATSCNKFLDEMPDNRTELDSEEKILKLLASAYPMATYAQYIRFMTDDYDKVSPEYNGNEERHLADAWAWLDDKDEGNDSPKFTWENFYLAIAHANQALQAIEELGNPERLDPMRGEALVARAWCHFKLVNLFCQHYSEAYGDTDLGIPYMEAPETEVNPQYERGSVKDVYEKIDRDLQEGLPLIDDSIYTVPKYHFNRLAALGFAAEFYLFYRDYEKSIDYANQVLGSSPQVMIRDLISLRSYSYDGLYFPYIAPQVNANLLLVTNVSEAGLNIAYGSHNSRYPHTEIVARSESFLSNSVLWVPTGDVPQQTFNLNTYGYTTGGVVRSYVRFTVPYLFELTDPVAQTGYAHSVMIAVSADNVLLMRAEANVLKDNPDYAAAMDDINLWVKTRINGGSDKTEAQVDSYYGGLEYYTSMAPTAKKKLNPEVAFVNSKQENFIHAILHLRRIEFWNEGHRWFDIKRYNIEITRRVVGDTQQGVMQEIDKLRIRDNRRALQLPLGVLAAGMEGNPR